MQDCTVYYISVNCSLYMFRVVTPPIIRSTLLYSQHLALVKPSLLPSAEGSRDDLTNARCCNYRYVLLMMGEVTTRNMYSEQFTEI